MANPTFLSEVERVLQEFGERGLEQLMFYSGVNLDLERPSVQDSVYAKVHGKNAGGNMEKVDEFIGVVVGDDFFPTTSNWAGVFKKAWLFTTYDQFKPGDEIVIQRQDDRRMAYRVQERSGLGTTTKVFTKWELSGIM